MKTYPEKLYRCYAPNAPEVEAANIRASGSFAARKVFAAQHTAMRVIDVIAIVIG